MIFGGVVLPVCCHSKLLALLGLLLLGITTAGAYSPPYASMVMDAHTGEVLHAKNADAIRHPASLTKLMTVYCLFEAIEAGKLSLQTRLPVSSHAVAQAPCRLGVKVGDRISVKDAIHGILVQSANDVAVVAAEALAESEVEFAKMMTRKARALGMTQTTFKNASGLPNLQQITTARDLTKLAIALRRDFPQYYHFFKAQTFHFRGRTYRNHNHLLGKVPGVEGLKTGFTNRSGFNLIASAKRGDRRLIAVVMGGASWRWRDKHMTNLLETHFDGDTVAKSNEDSSNIEDLIQNVATEVPVGEPQEEDLQDTQQTEMVLKDLDPSPTVRRPQPFVTPVLRPVSLEPSPSPPTGKSQGVWGVQLGVFKDHKSAHKAIQIAATQLSVLKKGTTSIPLIKAKKKHKKLYQAQVKGLTKVTAHHICQHRKKNGLDCLVLSR